METISRLRVLLMRAFAGEGGEEVMDELMAHKTCLLNLFEVGGRSAAEQKELEGGKTTLPSGHTLSVNADFTRQALFVSQQLEVSERYIAGILHALTVSSPHLHTQPVQCVEGAIDEYHLRRRHLADSLVYLLQATEAVSRGEAEGNIIFQRAAEFVYFDLFSTEGGLAPKIIKELQNLGVLVAKAEAAKKNARTGTIPPTGQTGVVPALGATVFQGHSESLQYERRQLGATLPLLARLGLLSSADVEAIVQWLWTQWTQNTNPIRNGLDWPPKWWHG
ncbi:unnamed protein product [Mycena citricolor]|uniref:Uncharacterized protein n=1 Tax=Mycena citricolor TaxID=2018698 RepID=A0AAD2H9J6_9AGAR|nr:unnamed protein product [Mycena citricolor]